MVPVVQTFLVKNNLERPFVKFLQFVSILSPTKMPSRRTISQLWHYKSLIDFTFNCRWYHFSKPGNHINLIIDLSTKLIFFTWLLNCRFLLPMFTPRRSMLSFTGILMLLTWKLKTWLSFPNTIAWYLSGFVIIPLTPNRSSALRK